MCMAATGPLQSDARSSSMSAMGTMQADTSEVRLATHLMKQGYPETGVGNRAGKAAHAKLKPSHQSPRNTAAGSSIRSARPGRGRKTELLVEACGGRVFGIHHNAGHRQRGAGVRHFFAVPPPPGGPSITSRDVASASRPFSGCCPQLGLPLAQCDILGGGSRLSHSFLTAA